MTEASAKTRAEVCGGGVDRYSTFLSLSGDAIGRFELLPPLDAAAREDDQVAHILAHARVTDCNELFARFYGREVAEMTGLAMGDFVPADDPARLHGIREFVRARFRLVYVEEEHVNSGGRSRWISASALGALEDGRLRGFWVCLREITERKRAERDRERGARILEAVAFSAARLLQPGSWRAQADEVLARLAQAAQVARVFLADKQDLPNGSTRLVFRAIWGAPGVATLLDDPNIRGGLLLEAEGLGRLADEMRAGRPVVTQVKELPAHERVLFERVGSRAIAVVPIFANRQWWGILGFGETRYEREWSASEVEALKAAASVIGAAIERERADEALRESEEQLRRARLMEAMGSLVAGVAHEVRNPLFSISAVVDALEPQLGERTAFMEYATLLRSQVHRLSQLMRDLLDYGKPSMLRPSPTSLAEVWRRASRACAALARERKVTVKERLAADVPSLDIDGTQLERAFENLLTNAIQHAPAGSAVLVLAGLDLSGPEPLVRCTVEDDGPGLGPESLERIFQPFFTRRKGGTGLGLPIVQRVLDAHGGRVMAENRAEGGARFTVLLPVRRAPEGGPRG